MPVFGYKIVMNRLKYITNGAYSGITVGKGHYWPGPFFTVIFPNALLLSNLPEL